MVGIVQRNRHIGVTQRLPGLCARENDILHTGAPQLFDTLLAQHPPDGIRHIALAAAVGTHNAGNAIVELKVDLVGKGLESVYLYTL